MSQKKQELKKSKFSQQLNGSRELVHKILHWFRFKFKYSIQITFCIIHMIVIGVLLNNKHIKNPTFLIHNIARFIILYSSLKFKNCGLLVELSLLTSVGVEILKVRSKRRDQNSDRVSSRFRAEPRQYCRKSVQRSPQRRVFWEYRGPSGDSTSWRERSELPCSSVKKAGGGEKRDKGRQQTKKRQEKKS